jgi:8-oxo-dGTP pyrophosphatase MutT (NUDIX family)
MSIKNNKFPKGVEIVGSAIIEAPDGNILLVRSPKWHNRWVMPGGHIEPGETINDALSREAKEEVGLLLESEGIIAYGELIDPKDFFRPAHFIYFDILYKTESQDVKLDNQELTDYKWVTPQEALKMDLAESYDKTIKDYIKFRELK